MAGGVYGLSLCVQGRHDRGPTGFDGHRVAGCDARPATGPRHPSAEESPEVMADVMRCAPAPCSRCRVRKDLTRYIVQTFVVLRALSVLRPVRTTL